MYAAGTARYAESFVREQVASYKRAASLHILLSKGEKYCPVRLEGPRKKLARQCFSFQSSEKAISRSVDTSRCLWVVVLCMCASFYCRRYGIASNWHSATKAADLPPPFVMAAACEHEKAMSDEDSSLKTTCGICEKAAYTSQAEDLRAPSSVSCATTTAGCCQDG